MIRTIRTLAFVLIGMFTIISSQNLSGQTQRNPVLEFCTGTWCQWCPCGDDMILDNILPNIPNAIILAYHGANNDPFRIFPGSNIISMLGLNSYPTGVIDRVTGIQNWNSGWTTNMNTRNIVPATVSIDITRSYNVSTREFIANVELTALQNLNGQYSYNIILVEDGQVYGQTSNTTCTPGITYIPDYVHYWLVRDMINGSSGEEVINGAWNQGQVITKTVSHTFTVPPSPAPDFIPDSCKLVVFVYKNGAPLNSNAEIQQAEIFPFMTPDYVLNLTSSSNDVLVGNNGVGEFSADIENNGLLDDSYYVDVTMSAPSGWTGEFTTPNGTFPVGQQDLVAVPSGGSLNVDISISPNFINGYGEITIEFTSMNDPNINVMASFNLVTLTGVTGLIVDASNENYGDLFIGPLDQEFVYPFGKVSREALTPSVDLTHFTLICWSTGNMYPVFIEDEVNALMPFLDNGGRLLINGQDIGKDIFDPNGQSQFAQSFFNNYMHTAYVADWGNGYGFIGIAGDPITDGISFTMNNIYTKTPDQISAYDGFATPLFTFSGPGETRYSSVRADDGVNRVVYLGVGLEQIADPVLRDSLVVRSLRWLMDGVVVSAPDDNIIASSFELKQNYPNPFNPVTSMQYAVGSQQFVTLKVYDILGKEIATLVNEEKPAGEYTVEFDASSLASGTYFYKLTAGEFVSVKKMSLLK